MKLQLTQEQKNEYVKKDHDIGRLFALTYVQLLPQYKKDTKLQILFDRLFSYNNFGDGDEYETKCWHDILDYLELNETYEKLWEIL